MVGGRVGTSTEERGCDGWAVVKSGISDKRRLRFVVCRAANSIEVHLGNDYFLMSVDPILLIGILDIKAQIL